jgi:RND family efflux transporter MFP subunit
MTWNRTARAAIGITLLAALAGCGAKETKQPATTAPHTALLGARDVATVGRADLANGVPVTGTLKPGVDVSLTAPYAEALQEVIVKEGQAVRRGQVLARFRTEAMGPVAAGADAQRRLAQSDYDRMQNLFKEGAVSQRDVDNAEATLRSAAAQWAQARKRLDDATVRAPMEGVVARRSVQSGDRVDSGDPLFRVVNTSSLEFEATVPTETIGRVKVGALVALTANGLGGAPLTGIVARINATADAATRQVRIYVAVPNRSGALVGDLFASGRVVLQRSTGVLALPAAGVHVGEDGHSFVWLVTNGRAEKRAITTGLADESQELVEITSGLKGGEMAIVGPVEGLVAGQPVQVARQES